MISLLQLQAELDVKYQMERESRASALNVQMGLVEGIIDISDSERNDEVNFEEWSDPEHAKLVETDRRLREQEEKDAEVVKMYQEMYGKNDGHQEVSGTDNDSLVEKHRKLREQEEKDTKVAMMYQTLYDQNATEAQITNVPANRILAQAAKPAGRERSPMEGGRRGRGCVGGASRAGNMNSMKWSWRRKGKKSETGSKGQRRVRFSNTVETICPSKS
ncbi:hypothetical protein CFC21_085017 [Triticum aestivum]|uniref:Uncharacterized protein n=2 Tax=Triticum aestivum TaxID=4565 RepID=A0A9R1L7Z1_WHEAT|nr:uncharacterized protein LOC119303485 [Triticum dicoccoides]KAF7081035.1 hypothetical protein CFC21_085017 [Triticum aestivum]